MTTRKQEKQAVEALRQLLSSADTHPHYDEAAGEYYITNPIDGSYFWASTTARVVELYLEWLAQFGKLIRSSPEIAEMIAETAGRPDNVSAEAVL